MHDSARTDLWEPWGSNPPGRPGPFPTARNVPFPYPFPSLFLPI